MRDAAVLGSARASRAGDGALAIANFGGDDSIFPKLGWQQKFVAARRRNQHARARALPKPIPIHFISSITCFKYSGISGSASKRNCIDPSGAFEIIVFNFEKRSSLSG